MSPATISRGAGKLNTIPAFTNGAQELILWNMGRNALLLASTLIASTLAFGPGQAMGANAASLGDPAAPFELNFTKGDTREGSKVRIRVIGDSLHYSRTSYAPGRNAIQTLRSAPLDVHRRIALKRIMGDLPQYRVFGSCYGKEMRYYLIDTPSGKFYRSVPERSGRCYTDEPGIWSLLEDLDTFITPPEDTEDRELSAGPERAAGPSPRS